PPHIPWREPGCRRRRCRRWSELTPEPQGRGGARRTGRCGSLVFPRQLPATLHSCGRWAIAASAMAVASSSTPVEKREPNLPQPCVMGRVDLSAVPPGPKHRNPPEIRRGEAVLPFKESLTRRLIAHIEAQP